MWIPLNFSRYLRIVLSVSTKCEAESIHMLWQRALEQLAEPSMCQVHQLSMHKSLLHMLGVSLDIRPRRAEIGATLEIAWSIEDLADSSLVCLVNYRSGADTFFF